jgi:thioredoxin-like negative regulator of GroEL
MIERFLIAVVAAGLCFAAFALLRQSHLRRASANGSRGEAPTLLYFRSARCAPCVTQSRLLAQLPAQVTGRVAIKEVDTGEQPDVASRYGVFTVPTTLLIDRDGVVRHINYGLADAGKLTRQVESVL